MESCESQYDQFSFSLRKAAKSVNPQDDAKIRAVESLDNEFMKCFDVRREKLNLLAALPPCRITPTPVFKI